jgi:heme-degrading monooxygenase HmoA
VFTRWASEEAFQDWVASNDFARAHSHGQGSGQPGGHGAGSGTAPVAASADLLAFEVIERVAAGG